MRFVAPDGPVYQAGTLSGNPVAMAAGKAQIEACLQPGFYEELAEKTKRFASGINAYADLNQFPFKVFHIGSIFWLAFSPKHTITSSSEIESSSMKLFSQFHGELCERGIYLGPSGYEVGFISRAHGVSEIETAITVICHCLDLVFKKC